MRRRRWRSYARPVQLASPVTLEFDGASAPGGGPRATPSAESEPWRPPSTHDRGAGQETAPLVGPRREAVWILLGQQASTFSWPPFARTFRGSFASPEQLIERVRLSVRTLLSSATILYERASICFFQRGCSVAAHQPGLHPRHTIKTAADRVSAHTRVREQPLGHQSTIDQHDSRFTVVSLSYLPLTTLFSHGFVYNYPSRFPRSSLNSVTLKSLTLQHAEPAAAAGPRFTRVLISENLVRSDSVVKIPDRRGPEACPRRPVLWSSRDPPTIHLGWSNV